MRSATRDPHVGAVALAGAGPRGPATSASGTVGGRR